MPVKALSASAVTDGDHATGATGAVAPPADGDHVACAAARALEPPRFCPACRRRMKVQVLPAGWRATCVEHGETRAP